MSRSEVSVSRRDAPIIVDDDRRGKYDVHVTESYPQIEYAEDDGLNLTVSYNTANEHGVPAYDVLVVGGQPYTQLSVADQQLVNEALRIHFSGRVSVLVDDDAYAAIVGEMPPWSR